MVEAHRPRVDDHAWDAAPERELEGDTARTARHVEHARAAAQKFEAVRLDQEGDELLVARRRVRPQVIPALLVLCRHRLGSLHQRLARDRRDGELVHELARDPLDGPRRRLDRAAHASRHRRHRAVVALRRVGGGVSQRCLNDMEAGARRLVLCHFREAEDGDHLRSRHEATHEACDLVFVHAAVAILDECLHGRNSAVNAEGLDPEENEPRTDGTHARGRDCAGRMDADVGMLARCAAVD